MRSAPLLGVLTVLFLTPAGVRSTEPPPSPKPNSASIVAAAASPDGKYVALGFRAFKPKEGMDKFPLVQLVDLGSRKVVRAFVGHKDQVDAVHFLPGGKRLLSVSEDATARLWDIRTGKLVRTITLPPLRRGGRSGAWPSPDGKRLLVWDPRVITNPDRTLQADYCFHVHELDSGKRLRTFAIGEVEVRSVRFIGDWKLALLNCQPLTTDLSFLKILDLTKREVILSYKHDISKWEVCVAGCLCVDHRFMVLDIEKRGPKIGSVSSYLALWNIAEDERERKFEARKKRVNALSLTLTPDGKGVLTVDSDDRVRLWDIATGKEVWSAPSPVTELARLVRTPTFLPGGKQFMLLGIQWGSETARVCFFNLAGGKAVREVTVEVKRE